jgi:hypothetical protein
MGGDGLPDPFQEFPAQVHRERFRFLHGDDDARQSPVPGYKNQIVPFQKFWSVVSKFSDSGDFHFGFLLIFQFRLRIKLCQ